MSATVGEIMNREPFLVRRDHAVAAARVAILGLGITAAPVVDDVGRPIGVVALRDLVGAGDAERVDARMTAPATVIRSGAAVRDAGWLLGETGLRHLVVVDDHDGRTVGMVSAGDVLRSLLGIAARHPQAFPHLDARGLMWTDDVPLVEERVEVAPDGPGVVLLVHDLPDRPARVVWAEWTHNVRTRLLDYLSLPQRAPELARWLERRDELFFRAAALASPELATTVVDELRARGLPPPSERALR
jgi:CBS domain-containing protein